MPAMHRTITDCLAYVDPSEQAFVTQWCCCSWYCRQCKCAGTHRCYQCGCCEQTYACILCDYVGNRSWLQLCSGSSACYLCGCCSCVFLPGICVPLISCCKVQTNTCDCMTQSGACGTQRYVECGCLEKKEEACYGDSECCCLAHQCGIGSPRLPLGCACCGVPIYLKQKVYKGVQADRSTE